MKCPRCGERCNFDLKEIQKNKAWWVTCATCGFNDSEDVFK